MISLELNRNLALEIGRTWAYVRIPRVIEAWVNRGDLIVEYPTRDGVYLLWPPPPAGVSRFRSLRSRPWAERDWSPCDKPLEDSGAPLSPPEDDPTVDAAAQSEAAQLIRQMH